MNGPIFGSEFATRRNGGMLAGKINKTRAIGAEASTGKALRIKPVVETTLDRLGRYFDRMEAKKQLVAIDEGIVVSTFQLEPEDFAELHSIRTALTGNTHARAN